MRPGPSALARAAVGVRVSVMRGGVVLATDVPARGVQVEWTADRVVPTQVTLEAPLDWVPTDPLSPLANFGQRVHVVSLLEVDGLTHEVELGWFQISEWSEGSESVSVTALDLMQLLEDDPMVWPSSPPPGATLRSELQRLAGDHLPVVLDDVVDVPVASTVQWDTSRTTSIRDLCESHGLGFGVRADGCLHVWERADGSDPVATYSARDLLVDAPRSSVPRRANQFTAVGSVGSGDDAVQVTASTEATAFPFEPGAYGRVRSRVEVSGATTQDAVQRVAQSQMQAAQIVSQTRPLEIVMDPRIEGGDVIGVITDTGEHLVGRVVAFSMTLDDPSRTMRVDVEVLQW